MSNTLKEDQARAGVAPGDAPCWLFAGVRFEERSLQLTVSGEPTALEPKPMEVLRHLLRHAGEVVTHEELERAVWPGRVLSDTVLKKCISRLREALRDEGESIIKTVRGYGYRLVAAVTVEPLAGSGEPAPRFEFAPGDPAPLRPHWKLARCLGGGGHGEAWLVQHEKTAQQRVLKFAQGEQALVGLKREITLYRLLHDTLGSRADFVQIIDWNLEEAPYFIESEYVEGGNLADWAARHGGLNSIALDTRVALAAEIAEALAAAHSVGVLHKDLKPANVLVCAAAADAVTPAIKLVDFGSGGVLDPARLDALGITRLGFTRAVGEMSSSGTPAYLAPEILTGQPATVRADVYALGVLLFQLVAGDFMKPLAPGWEQYIADPLLREDIAEAAQGDPARRLGDAAAFALRLRSLPQRRQQRADEEAQRDSAARTAKALERFRARRTGLLIAIGVLVMGLAATLTLYLKLLGVQQQREAALVQSKQVTDYLVSLFEAASPDKTGGKPIAPRLLVDEGRKKLDVELRDQPVLKARMLGVLGKAYAALSINGEAIKTLREALALQKNQADAEPLLTAAIWQELGSLAFMQGENDEARKAFAEALALRRRHAPANDPAMLESMATLGYLNLDTDYERGMAELKRAQQMAVDAGQRAREAEVLTYLNVGYQDRGQFDQALAAIERALQLLKQTGGEDQQDYLECLGYKVRLLALLNRWDEAEALGEQLLASYVRLNGPESALANNQRFHIGVRLHERGKISEALAMQSELVNIMRTQPLTGTARFADALARYGDSLRDHGELTAALAALHESVLLLDARREKSPLIDLHVRLSLARTLLDSGDAAGARRLIPAELPPLPTAIELTRDHILYHLLLAELALQQGHTDEAQVSLTQAAQLKPVWLALPAELERLRLLLMLRRGQAAEAHAAMQARLAAWQKTFAPQAPWLLALKLDDVEALLALNQRGEAANALKALGPQLDAALAPSSPLKARAKALQGQL